MPKKVVQKLCVNISAVFSSTEAINYKGIAGSTLAATAVTAAYATSAVVPLLGWWECLYSDLSWDILGTIAWALGKFLWLRQYLPSRPSSPHNTDSVHIAQNTLHRVHFIQCTKACTVHSIHRVHCALPPTLNYTQHSAHCTWHTVHISQKPAHCTVHIPVCWLSPAVWDCMFHLLQSSCEGQLTFRNRSGTAKVHDIKLNVHSTDCTLHSALCTLHSAKLCT